MTLYYTDKTMCVCSIRSEDVSERKTDEHSQAWAKTA